MSLKLLLFLEIFLWKESSCFFKILKVSKLNSCSTASFKLFEEFLPMKNSVSSSPSKKKKSNRLGGSTD